MKIDPQGKSVALAIGFLVTDVFVEFYSASARSCKRSAILYVRLSES